MTRPRTTSVLALCTLGCLVSASDQPKLVDIPARVDPNRPLIADGHTALLWRFDKPGLHDSSPWKNEGQIVGRAKAGAEGRFGGALALAGGEDVIFLPQIKGLAWYSSKKLPQHLTIEFWARFESAPTTPACLFELASTDKRGSALRIELRPDCHLAVTTPGLEEAVSKAPIAVARWFHVAVIGYEKWYEALCLDTGLDVLVNGFLGVPLRAGGNRYHFPPASTRDYFCLGNSLRRNAGFAGRIDEFRISNAKRHYLRLVEQPWIKPQDSAPLSRSAEFFRMPERIVFHEPFDDDKRPQEIRLTSGLQSDTGSQQEQTENQDPVVQELDKGEAEGAGGLDTIADDLKAAGAPEKAGPQDKTGLGAMSDKLKTELKVLKKLRSQGQKPPREKRIAAESGVKGRGLSVGGLPRGAIVPLPQGLDLREGGTIELWLKPGDWDNRTAVPSHASGIAYRDTVRRVLTLWGKSEDGKEQALVSLKANRVIDRPRHTLEPYRWTHVVMFWGNGVRGAQPVVYLNGKSAGNMRLASRAGAKTWDAFRQSHLTLGDAMETAFDEIRIYDYPFYPIEAQNAWAQCRGEAMQKLEPAVCRLNYRMSVGKMQVGVDVMLPQPERVTRATVEFETGSDRGVVRDTIENFKYGQGHTELDVGELPEGRYECRGVLLAADGKELGRFAQSFHRMKLEWLHNKLGYVDTPPPPFEPITRKEATVTAVGREYTVGPNGLFTSIRVKGQEIVARPIHFELKQGGQQVALKPGPAPSFGKTVPTEATWQGSVSGGGLDIRSAATFEYDGMAKFVLDVVPAAGEANVERLSLVIPLKEQYARLWHVLPVGGNFRYYERAGYLHTGKSKGLLWSSKIMHKYSRSSEWGAAGNLVHQVWLGGIIRGLCWFADNDRGWVPSTKQPMVTVTRKGEAVELGLHFISEPYTMAAPRQIVFGLIATPSKPLWKNHRLWARGHTEKVGPIGGRLTSCDSFSGWQTHPRGGTFAYYPKGYDWDFAKKASDRQRQGDLSKFPPGQALMMYHDRRYVYPHWQTQYFDWEWRSGSFPPTKVDCLVWYMNEWFGRNIFDGIYIDDVYPYPDHNAITGTAYKLPDGRVQVGNCYFAYREYLKRVYNVLHSHGKPPLITTHMTSTLEVPLHSFVTAIYDGENKGRYGNLRSTFMDAWPLDRLLTLNNSERTGLVTSVMLKDSYASRQEDKRKYAHMIWRTWRSAYAVWLLFDMRATGYRGEIAQVVNRYYGLDVTVHPFWRNQEVVQVEPLLEKPIDAKHLPSWGWGHKVMKKMIAENPLRATLYQKEDGILLALANFAKINVTGRVKIDFDALGLDKDKQAKLRGTDVDAWPPPEGADPLNPKKIEVKLEVNLRGEEEEVDPARDLEPESEEDKTRVPIKEGAVELEVLPHNYRLVEFTWQPED